MHGAGPGGSSEAAPVLAWGGPKQGLRPQRGDSEEELGQVQGELQKEQMDWWNL